MSNQVVFLFLAETNIPFACRKWMCIFCTLESLWNIKKKKRKERKMTFSLQACVRHSTNKTLCNQGSCLPMTLEFSEQDLCKLWKVLYKQLIFLSSFFFLTLSDPFNRRNPSSLSQETVRHAVRVCGLKVTYSIYQMIESKSYRKRTTQIIFSRPGAWGNCRGNNNFSSSYRTDQTFISRHLQTDAGSRSMSPGEPWAHNTS